MNLLRDLVRSARREVAEARVRLPLREARARARDAEPPRPFREVLRRRGEVALIAEIKRASPVKGVFDRDLDAAETASEYARAGARAVSVLTNRRFLGSNQDLVRARAAVGIPVLRKEFIVDEYQIWESRALGADAVLLLSQVLEESQLREYREMAAELGMASLVEAFTEEGLAAAVRTGAEIVGVNNRDLETFEVDLERGLRLRERVPAGIVFVSESGIASREDVRRLAAARVDAMLVGEEIVRSADRAAKIRELLGKGR